MKRLVPEKKENCNNRVRDCSRGGGWRVIFGNLEGVILNKPWEIEIILQKNWKGFSTSVLQLAAKKVRSMCKFGCEVLRGGIKIDRITYL